jgi:hypothetical protein
MTAHAPSPGRSCPLHYRYGPAALNVPAPDTLRGLDVLYVVGGLYGNDLALERILTLFDAEAGTKRLVFNGDFHWFDIDHDVFSRVQHTVLEHIATRGNVETELCGETKEEDAGCGCAYPEWVADDVVERSNRILARLRRTVTPEQRQQLAALPMWARAEVGDLRIAVVHGDAESLAGWSFAQEHLQDAKHRDTVDRWFALAGADAFACSHTCLPVFQELRSSNDARSRWILNNGAAGMPNFEGDPAGLLTRIALSPATNGASRFGVRQDEVFIDAIAIEVDPDDARQRFLAQWPSGSDAHRSYFERIERGPRYRADQALRTA